MIVLVAVLFAVFGSNELVVTDAVFVTVLPTAPVGRTMIWNVAVWPLARLPASKVTTPPTGVTPPVAETNVVFAGSVSAIDTPAAALGPAFETTSVYVRSVFGETALGDAVFVIDTSAVVSASMMVVVSVIELSSGNGSVASLDTVAVALSVVPFAKPASTCVTSVNRADAPLANEGAIAVIVPVSPTLGDVTDQPAGAVNDWNVVLAGTSMVNVAFAASDAPLFVTLIV